MGFRLISDEKTILEVPVVEDLEDRLLTFGRSKAWKDDSTYRHHQIQMHLQMKNLADDFLQI